MVLLEMLPSMNMLGFPESVTVNTTHCGPNYVTIAHLISINNCLAASTGLLVPSTHSTVCYYSGHMIPCDHR